MSDLRTAAQQALEALERIAVLVPRDDPQAGESITALRAALAEPEPFNPDWDRIEPLQENLREHMAEIQRLRAKLADGDNVAPTEPVQEPDVPETNFGNMEPVGWFEGPFGEFRANELFKHSWPAQTVAWSIPLYTSPPQRPADPVQEQPICDECGRKKADGWALYCVDCVEPMFAAPQRKPLTEEEPQCNPHPKAPHGFLRNASHTEDRYVCECEGWEPYEAGYQAGMEAALRAQS